LTTPRISTSPSAHFRYCGGGLPAMVPIKEFCSGRRSCQISGCAGVPKTPVVGSVAVILLHREMFTPLPSINSAVYPTLFVSVYVNVRLAKLEVASLLLYCARTESLNPVTVDAGP